MRKAWAAVVTLGLGMFATAAGAQEPVGALRCEHYANGQLVTDVSSYPAVVVVDTYIYNDSTTEALTLTSIFDWPNHTSPSPVNITVEPGSSTGGTTTFTLESYAQCAQLANHEERAEAGKPIHLKTFTKVRTATGEKTKCVARVICH